MKAGAVHPDGDWPAPASNDFLRLSPLRLERVGSRAVADRTARLFGEEAELLGQRGVPVVPMPPHVRAAVMEALDETDPRPPRGLASLREAIAVTLRSDYDIRVDPDRQLLITHGGMHGVSVALRTLLRPGEEVVIPAPTFFFEGLVRSISAQPVYVRGSESEGWRWDVDAIEAAITPHARVLLLCNPNNPTGYLPKPDEVRAVVELAARHGLVIVSDESYQRYAFEGGLFTPVERFRDVYSNLVTVTSFSKNYALSSWRVGYIVAPEDLLDACANMFEWDAIYCGYVAQKVALAAITGPQEWITTVIDSYQNKRDTVYGAIERSPVLKATVKPAAGPFMLLNCEALGQTEEEIDQLLLGRGIVTVPGRYFRAPTSHVRLLYGASTPMLEKLADELGGLAEAIELVASA